MISIHVRKSALKHGITKKQILHVLTDDKITRFFQIHDDTNNNPQEMAVGFTQNEVLLEIGITYTDKADCVFHAKRASSKYKILFEEKRL